MSLYRQRAGSHLTALLPLWLQLHRRPHPPETATPSRFSVQYMPAFSGEAEPALDVFIFCSAGLRYYKVSCCSLSAHPALGNFCCRMLLVEVHNF